MERRNKINVNSTHFIEVKMLIFFYWSLIKKQVKCNKETNYYLSKSHFP
jgi:hypothetical protein